MVIPTTEKKIEGTTNFKSYAIGSSLESQRLCNPRYREHFKTAYASDEKVFHRVNGDNVKFLDS